MIEKFSADALSEHFDEDRLYEFTNGECLDFASALSKAIGDEPHEFLALLYPQGRRTIIAHVAVCVGSHFYDADGVNDKTSLLVEWSYKSGIHHSKFSLEKVRSLSDVRLLAEKLNCEFFSDSEENSNAILETLQEMFEGVDESMPDVSIRESVGI